MSVLNEGIRLGDVLINEFDDRYCRAVYTAQGAIALGQVLKNGTTPATQRTAAVAADTVACNAVALNAAADGGRVVVLERGPALVNKSGLVYDAAANQGQKDAQVAQLKTIGIVAR